MQYLTKVLLFQLYNKLMITINRHGLAETEKADQAREKDNSSCISQWFNQCFPSITLISDKLHT